ncbi:hypothetical protein ACFWBG_11170 [Nocardia salmonicida]|uniref:hypothetical protein n=1 Tax=Nocardia salmonicida TaxID=53431 RepID=UPI00366E7CD0
MPTPLAPRHRADIALSLLDLDGPTPHPQDASTYAFPDGGHWRTEIPSVEGPRALQAVLEEAARLHVPIHRISQGSGIWMLTDAEITEMVRACTESGIELCLFTGPRAGWDIAATNRVPRAAAGPRAYGHAALRGCVEDAIRATDLGVGCILVADEGVLWTLHQLRERGALPATTTLKVSALIGPVNAVSFALFERLGADSINVPSDLPSTHLTEIRRTSRAPLDLYIEAPDDLGGFVRIHETAEFIRRGAPLYLKFGLSNSPVIYPAGAHLSETVVATARERVRRGRLILDALERWNLTETMSPPGSRQPGPLQRFALPDNDNALTAVGPA